MRPTRTSFRRHRRSMDWINGITTRLNRSASDESTRREERYGSLAGEVRRSVGLVVTTQPPNNKVRQTKPAGGDRRTDRLAVSFVRSVTTFAIKRLGIRMRADPVGPQ